MCRYTTQSHPVLQAVSFIELILSINRSLYVQHVVEAGCRVGIRRDPVGAAIGNYLGKVKGQPLGRYPPHFGPRFEPHLPIGLEINPRLPQNPKPRSVAAATSSLIYLLGERINEHYQTSCILKWVILSTNLLRSSIFRLPLATSSGDSRARRNVVRAFWRQHLHRVPAFHYFNKFRVLGLISVFH